jgi:hypothetical protein
MYVTSEDCSRCETSHARMPESVRRLP